MLCLMDDFGPRLRKLRDEIYGLPRAGMGRRIIPRDALSEEEWKKRANTFGNTINKIESQYKDGLNPTLQMLTQLANSLGLTVTGLFVCLEPNAFVNPSKPVRVLISTQRSAATEVADGDLVSAAHAPILHKHLVKIARQLLQQARTLPSSNTARQQTSADRPGRSRVSARHRGARR